MISKNNFFYFVIFLFVVSCSSVPKQPSNACKIFGEKYLWYKNIKKSSEKYDVPIHIILAFVNKESGFNRWAKPERQKLFKIIPYKRPSSSYGYSQAVKKTWEQYKKETGNPLALRTHFKDSVMEHVENSNLFNTYIKKNSFKKEFTGTLWAEGPCYIPHKKILVWSLSLNLVLA